jgi:hypothetical protein
MRGLGALRSTYMAGCDDNWRRARANPSAESVVDVLKQKTAELIDLCETLKVRDARLAALAQTAYEEAAMWAVKAATAVAK